MLSVKYDLPLLNWDTRFSLWQVKMQAVLSQTNLDNALDDFGKKDVKYYYVREVTAEAGLKVSMISTHDNLADMMTKPIYVAKFELCSSSVDITI
jgi:hypothetical protein